MELILGEISENNNIQKINQLERRFRKDDSYYQYYKAFMDDMLAKKYAKKSASPASLGKTWYVPHHCVFNPNKLIAEKHRSFLQFLWWKDSDINKSKVDHEMRVHVFGGVSSPSCSNYVLRKTVQLNQEEYGKDAPETLRRSFYVDDFLNSVNTR